MAMTAHGAPLRRLRFSRVLVFVSGVLLCFVYTLSLRAQPPPPRASAQRDGPLGAAGGDVRAGAPERVPTSGLQEEVLVLVVNRTDLEQCVYVDPKPLPAPSPPATTAAPPTELQPPPRGDYPDDLFSLEQRQQGWVVLHVAGMVYMFVALAIICDEFFVPGLEVITSRLQISEDVAGATFMAAGGSAPELFTSLIGVFVSHSNVGIGTIVGSAVFNILFVIGMCAIFSREMLHLTWWPLFRDVSFYVLDLTLLIVFFLDKAIVWWESVLLVLAYVSYVSFMKFNGQIEQAVKSQINKHMSVVKVWTADGPEKESEAPPPPPPPAPSAAPPLPAAPPTAPKDERKPEPDPEPPNGSPPSRPPRLDRLEDTARLRVRPVLLRGGSTASLHNASLRNTIFQLMIHTLDPLGEDKKTNVELVDVGAAAGPSTSQSQNPDQTADKTGGESEAPAEATQGSAGGVEDQSSGEESSGSSESDDGDDGSEEEENEEEDEKKEPLSLDWPETRRKQVTYLLLLPILLPLWLTLPDVRNLASRRYFVVTFIGSILWIGVFSYLMVWWAHQVGETVGISEEIMGLTILAAGTSIPDLITSVIVARKGLGDMAVSSSVGSNIFDITIGLPVPWLLYTVLHNGEPVAVSSNGLFCAIVLLFLMLHFVIISIAACRWKMSRMLGLTMFVLYFIFLVLSVLLEKRLLVCPVSI